MSVMNWVLTLIFFSLGPVLWSNLLAQEEPLFAEKLRVKYAQDQPNFRWHADSTWLCISKNNSSINTSQRFCRYCLCDKHGRTLDTLYLGKPRCGDPVYSQNGNKMALTNRSCELDSNLVGTHLVLMDIASRSSVIFGCWIWADVSAQCWSPDANSVVVSIGKDDSTLLADVVVMNAEFGTPEYRIEGYRCAAWHPKDPEIIIMGNDVEVIQYNLRKDKIVSRKEIPDDLRLSSISWTKDGRTAEINTYELNTELRYRSKSRTLTMKYRN